MKKGTEFKLPYVGVDHDEDYDFLYGLNGEFSVIIKIDNPVLQYAAAPEAYEEFHNLFVNIIKILGEGFYIQKQDIFSRSKYEAKKADEYLQNKYNEHFAGRDFIKVDTYLTLTKQVKRGAFYVYDKKVIRDFKQSLSKVIDVLTIAGTNPKPLREKAINIFVMRVLSMEFANKNVSLNNIAPTDTEINIGDKIVRSISLVNIDNIDLPSQISTHIELNDKDTMKGFPVDLFSFLFKVPEFETILFNQVIEVPNQMFTLNKLELKRKRHSGIPDPANLICVEDIDLLLNDVARDNQLLVNSHFNIVLSAESESVQRATNFIESSLFQLGIIPSKNAYNQLELFRCALPGNGAELKKYDWFLTTADAALCLFFKEALAVDEISKFQIRFTDRQGVPIAIDPADLPMSKNRINNRNKFVLGPSGSGKSFFMNALIEQYMLYNMDVVIVDTGHSYSGLNSYYKGKYITYSDNKPITMNPFAISEEEYNIEKKDFLCTLICLLWQGAEGNIGQVERDVIANVISSYYAVFFSKEIEGSKIASLNFNSFYEFAIETIPKIKVEENIPFNVDEFRYVLKKFYKEGEFEAILNEDADKSLFTERFIVFEIDSIKEHKILFPIVTLIIMDVFIQKMRNRTGFRKALIIEEAWKAIASPLMAGYILYLYKTVRKFWGEAIVVTQELGDIIGNAVVKDSIVNNSDTICLLDQTKFKDNYKEIAALLSINEVERKKIFTINQLDNTDNRGRFKEVYIRRGSTGEVYGVEVSLFQYLTYTTEKPEKSAVEIYTSAYGSYADGLDAFVKDMIDSESSLGDFVSAINKNAKPLHTVNRQAS
ncbi:TraG family conjugative transposon ATPase [Pedobacter polaris]|uniref:TraG family conjugative transposon ATPase n=1 Tax=Pedobacter polaris TaxID=2571273 RepID=A0A4U1CL91_9SPHI|nr:TraG family conjugative transposon ATPase [Pedobacter polaris]TKC08017.1 TraG family conjugative transposon ATPase [Pedobacter polaris]